jgi:Glycerol-3-phosphate dehydrogenase
MKNASMVFIATPSIVFEQIIERIRNLLEEDSYVISCTKGILGQPFRSLTDTIISDVGINIGVLSGPNLAKEIADNKVAGSVIASLDSDLVDSVKTVLSSATFKIYSSNDVQGVELAGALKNIYAIICGLAEAIEVGENAIGLILTRSMAEMSRFAVAKGANPITFLGLAGMGDLVATCTSRLSRNYQLGYNIGKGMDLNKAKEDIGQVAEGIRTLDVIKNESSELDIKMPLVESLYNIIYEEGQPHALISDLVKNPHEVDVEFKY